MASLLKQYSDLDAAFSPNLVTGDLSLRKDSNAIKFSIKSLILTQNFERPFNSSIGSQVKRLVFEPMDDLTKIVLQSAVTTAVENHEPRIKNVSVRVDMIEDKNMVVITITYQEVVTNITQTLLISLDRTR